jgi:hypothetical protein
LYFDRERLAPPLPVREKNVLLKLPRPASPWMRW